MFTLNSFRFIVILFFVLTNIQCQEISIFNEPLSFINLLPKIISNVRYIEEELIYSNNIYSTFPNLTLDLTSSSYGNLTQCRQDVNLLTRDFLTLKRWALKTMDAWGKVPSGVLFGDLYWIGSSYECSHHLSQFNRSIIEQPFYTKQCIIGLRTELSGGYSLAMAPLYGVCVPESCNSTDVIELINNRLIIVPTRFKLSNDSIHCIEKRSLSPVAILTIILLCCLFLLILLATGMHIFYGRHVIKINQPPVIETSATVHTDIEDENYEEENERSINTTNPNEVTPLIIRRTNHSSVDSAAQNLIERCSLVNNYNDLLHKTSPANLACLNGIRVLSMFWIILGHTILFGAFYSNNLMTVFNWSKEFWFQIIINAYFSIDSFFLISGILAAYIFFRHKNDTNQPSIVKFMINHYIYRYLRLTPLYLLILLISITLSPYLGQSGPLFPPNGIESNYCRRNWWRNLLYINNFGDVTKSCLPVSWFLAVSMQLHWISPLFLLTVAWKWFVGILVALAFIFVDIISTSVIISRNPAYEYGTLAGLFLNNANHSNSTSYFEDVYIKPWCRVAPYAVGLIVGYMLYTMNQRKISSWDFSSVQSRLVQETEKRYRSRQIFLWIFALVILLLCLFGTYGDYAHSTSFKPLTRSGRISFLVLSRLAWAIGLSVLILACFTGHGGIIDRFLSCSVIQKLSKLTYGAYLWHPLVIAVSILGRDLPLHYSGANILFHLIAHIIISYCLSLVTYLFFELPVLQLMKLGLKRNYDAFNRSQ